jgi:hypothetical protein
MVHEVPIVERALQLARTGKYASTADVRFALKREGYSAVDLMQITGTLSLQLRRICKGYKAPVG